MNYSEDSDLLRKKVLVRACSHGAYTQRISVAAKWMRFSEISNTWCRKNSLVIHAVMCSVDMLQISCRFSPMTLEGKWKSATNPAVMLWICNKILNCGFLIYFWIDISIFCNKIQRQICTKLCKTCGNYTDFLLHIKPVWTYSYKSGYTKRAPYLYPSWPQFFSFFICSL